jgi:hypothetical protein
MLQQIGFFSHSIAKLNSFFCVFRLEFEKSNNDDKFVGGTNVV